jgi:RNAse (barnase) inhibitor barstar
MVPFVFTDTPNSVDDAVVVSIPSGLDNMDSLFDVLRTQLGLPDYFGANLDALSEVLRDLHWVDQACVVLVHDGSTFKDAKLFGVYLSILQECVEDWKRDQEGRLVVVFPSKMEEQVASLLASETAGQ